MKKLNVILDESTILNFSFFGKLIRRYLVTALIVPLLTGAFFFYQYKSQNLIFFQSQSFNNNAVASETSGLGLKNILGESGETTSPGEIISIYSSLDFRERLAKNIYDTNEYDKLNFNGINSKDQKTASEVLSSCGGDEGCMIKIIGGSVAGMYSIINDRFLEKKFIITVKSLDKWTTQFVLKVIEKTIKEVHLESLKRNVSKQKELTLDLLNTKKAQMNDASIVELSREAEENEEKLKHLKSRIAFVTRELATKQSEEALFDSKLVQTKSAMKSRFSNSELKDMKKARVLNQLLNKQRQDLSAIEVSLQGVSLEDSEILKELKKEIRKNEKELYAIPNYRSYIDASEKFFQEKQDKSRDIAFEAKVVKDQIRRLKEEYERLQAEHDALALKKKEFEANLVQVKPTMDYIKLLEGKVVQFNLMESTVVPEFVFSKNISDVGVFKKTSLSRIAIFGLFTTLFFVFTVVFIRYLFDSKIYDEYELKKNFEDIEVIGKTPKFN